MTAADNLLSLQRNGRWLGQYVKHDKAQMAELRLLEDEGLVWFEYKSKCYGAFHATPAGLALLRGISGEDSSSQTSMDGAIKGPSLEASR